jgi:hypothetical protein
LNGLENTQDLFDEVFVARIFAGFHYRYSLEHGGGLGQKAAEQLFRWHFRRFAELSRGRNG